MTQTIVNNSIEVRPNINDLRAKYNLLPFKTAQTTFCGNEIAKHCQSLYPDSGNLSFDLEGRNFYLDLSRRLQVYYSGINELIPSHWSKHYGKTIESHKRRYISLYDLLDFAWEDIKKVARKNGYKLLQETPAQAVKAILEADVVLEIAKFQDNNPRKNYWKLGEQARDCEPTCKVKLNTLMRKLYQILPDDYREIKNIELICIHCVRQIKPVTPDLESRIRKFEKAEQGITKHVRTLAHPSRKVKNC